MLELRLTLAAAALLLTGSARGYPDNATMLAEINALRADPQGYADMLREYRRGFRGKIHYNGEDDEVGWATREGADAVDEAIAALDRLAPLPPLGPGRILEFAAGDHGAAQGRDGSEGHIGAGGTVPGARVKRRGGDIYVAEVISYGSNTAADALRQLVIDDGVRNRGHRKLLMQAQYKFAGAWCGPHPRWRAVCVVDLAATPDGKP